jgi:hypothetical protein
MKVIFDLIMSVLPSLFKPLTDFIKLELLRVYIEGIDSVRRAYVLALLGVFTVVLGLCGFVMAHIALFMLLPWSTPVNALVLLGVGTFYFLLSLVIVLKLCSRRLWLKVSGAEGMARGIARGR